VSEWPTNPEAELQDLSHCLIASVNTLVRDTEAIDARGNFAGYYDVSEETSSEQGALEHVELYVWGGLTSTSYAEVRAILNITNFNIEDDNERTFDLLESIWIAVENGTLKTYSHRHHANDTKDNYLLVPKIILKQRKPDVVNWEFGAKFLVDENMQNNHGSRIADGALMLNAVDRMLHEHTHRRII